MQESCKFGLYNDGVDTNEGERNDGETKATCDDKRIKRSPKRNEGKFCRRISGKSADDSNDLIYLSQEYPVYTERGRNGGIYVDKDFYLNQRYLSKAQQDLLLRLGKTLEGEDRRIMENILKTFGEKEDGR